jgi:capsular polysaccharide biosynthesis protein
VELREYGALLWRRWPIWAGLTVVALAFSAVFGLFGPNSYESTMRLAVGTEPLPTAVGYYDPNYYSWLSSEYLADDLSELLKSETFAQDVSTFLGSRVEPRAISDVTRTKKTHRLLDVTVSAPTPEQAQALGLAYEKAINAKLPDYFPQLRVVNAHVSILNHPSVSRALTPALLLGSIAVRTLVGLLLGLALSFLVDYLDASVRDRDEAERLLGTPLLAAIPRHR